MSSRRALASAMMAISLIVAAAAPASGSASATPVLTIDEATTLEQLVNSSDYDSQVQGDVLRLYRAFFDREPDVGGAPNWIAVNRGGWSLDQIAEFFTQRNAFANSYAGTTDRTYITRIFSNVLDRDYDQEGFDYWLRLLETRQLTRGGIVRWTAANNEFIQRYKYEPSDHSGSSDDP